ncbi:enoyl-CoA hydratase [Nesterenkonia alkaliphila]|uniref:Probable enoyl-CoA hydratase echA8 n=1 Tax=Nesterenkonia alkaliphila TaxID=1463631 RepID=A0A7K1UJZ0_9MICC|nr:enoyl-CoA hydratase [Nesterenkonia alkaliphila]MVT26724.1 enoyl-CoA hydratase [Nesterenkonia alkaliphila]GFZ76992.1 enoyl-CoA hydratase [Nesterenkonia alkaliphila]
MTEYSTILVSTSGRVGTIQLNRPKALNALNETVMEEVITAATAFDADPRIGAIVLTGSDKAFAAGADIKQMADMDYPAMYAADFFQRWEDFAALRTPVVAAVNGYALGGGCELAMMTDVIIAGESAKFGQPEINLGVIPGMGGSQRLARSVGKAKTMDMVLTGRHIDAAEAERIGLVSRVVADDQTLAEATKVAETIAAKSKPATQLAKEAVASAFETSLSQGLLFERRIFHSLFSTEDQAEGMAAFAEKREPQWKHR